MAEINADAQVVIAFLGQKNSDLAVENAILNARLREAADRLDALEGAATSAEPSTTARSKKAPVSTEA